MRNSLTWRLLFRLYRTIMKMHRRIPGIPGIKILKADIVLILMKINNKKSKKNTMLSKQCIKFAYMFNVRDLNQNIVKSKNPLKGLVHETAIKIQADLAKNPTSQNYHFDEVTTLDFANPQIYNLPTINFPRQVLACIVNNQLYELPSISQDIKNRAKFYEQGMNSSIGAYSATGGFPFIKKQIAQQFFKIFIQRRDLTAKEVDYRDLILTDGATQALRCVFNALIKDSNDGIMIPIPVYPFYPAYIDRMGGKQIPYYLNEDHGWEIKLDELEWQHKQAVSQGTKPKVIVVINPGNPTAHVLSRRAIENIIKFASDNKLIIIADEVYQDNTFSDFKRFISMRKVREEMSNPYKFVEMFSFNSISKGFMSECGFRGGYVHMSELDPKVADEIRKSKVLLSESNNVGQVIMGLMVSPPTKEEGCSEETFQSYWNQRTQVMLDMKRRSDLVFERLNDIRGITCQEIQGAMYAFPRVRITEKFLKAAEESNFQDADTFYCMNVLKDTGLVLLPGSGFSQKPGTMHFRMTLLSKTYDQLNQALIGFRFWHERFMREYV